MPEKGCPISTDEVEYLHARAQRLGQPQPVPFSAVELHFEAGARIWAPPPGAHEPSNFGMFPRAKNRLQPACQRP